ncbi:ferritin-like domain-containing protein [Infundibulicybe gibba]|nr:ferritin-like domain-containing protein [Infundibulicybe gibba]
MKYSMIFSALSLFSITQVAYALPAKHDGPTDGDILNFLLTLEYMESAFYEGGLAKCSEDDFQHAGLPSWVRPRYEQIAAHEKVHVKFLQGALAKAGIQAVEPCAYNFPYDKPESFIRISSILESVGTSAYVGASALISNKVKLHQRRRLHLGVEARHNAWIHVSAMKQNPWIAPFESSLTPAQALTLAHSFIESCPSSNPEIHVRSFPPLSLSSNAQPGGMTTLAYKPVTEYKGFTYAAFTSGHETIFVQLDQANKNVQVPTSLKGGVFVFITKTNDKVTDDSIIAGPAAAHFVFEESR